MISINFVIAVIVIILLTAIVIMMQTPLPWTTGHCVGLARALHICSSLLMVPNHKLPTMLYALALVSEDS